DAAAPFARQGFRVEAWFRPRTTSADGDSPPEIGAITTETRHLEARRAAELAARCARALDQHRTGYFYKKIDSRLRGPWVAELEAVRSALDVPLVPLCPAFPRQGRTLVRGVVRVHGRPTDSCIEAFHQAGLWSVVGVPANGRRQQVEMVAALQDG